MNSGKETITLSFSMDDNSWSHWAQGRGRKAASAVVLKGLCEIRKNPKEAEKIRLACESVSRRVQKSSGEATQTPHRIEIKLPASDWGEACQRVGKPGNPVHPAHLLTAIIFESESWKQVGNDDAEFSSGYYLVDLDSSLDSLTEGFSLGSEARVIAWIVAAATVANAVAALWPIFLAPQ